MAKKLIPFLFLFLALPGYCFGFETRGQDCSKCHTLNKDDATNLLQTVFPGVKVLEVSISPAKGLWEVFSELSGRKGIVYVDFSKKYVFTGNLLSITEKKNVTQERFSELTKVDVSQIPLGNALVMGDPQAKSRIIVFDDPD